MNKILLIITPSMVLVFPPEISAQISKDEFRKRKGKSSFQGHMVLPAYNFWIEKQ